MHRRLSSTVVVDSVVCRYDAVPALDGVTVDIAAGEFAGIVGPNGSGKTTLLRTMNALVAPARGTVLLEGRELSTMSPQQVASVVASVPQRAGSGFGFTVRDIVLMGRTPHLPPLAGETARDLAVARQAMERTGTWPLADRPVDTLSGGEFQRVLVARALAQEPRVLLLDEPTAHLDIRFQLEIMDLLSGLRGGEFTVVAALHDLNLAAAYCDRLVLLDRGRIAAMGTPGEVLTPSRLAQIYGAVVIVQQHPTTGRPHVIVTGRRAPVQDGAGEDEKYRRT